MTLSPYILQFKEKYLMAEFFSHTHTKNANKKFYWNYQEMKKMK